MKKRSVVKAMQDNLEETNPSLVKVAFLLSSFHKTAVQILVHERDAYMVEKLHQLEGRVVGVVGLGHLDGIERLWNKQGSM